MDRFERRREHSKEDIRRAAEELFTKFGIDKVSVNDIALKAGVSQATVYNNFGTKENLIHDYRKSIVNTIAGKFRGILVLKKSYVEKLQGLLQSWIDLADRYKVEVDSPETKSAQSPIGSEIEGLFGEFIQEGKKQGNLRSDISDEAMIAYIKFYRQGVANNPKISARMRTDPQFSSDLLSLFMRGVVKD
jgi:AcrR family transcriptional regulator